MQVKIEGFKELDKAMTELNKAIEKNGRAVMDKVANKTADGIKAVFDGSNVGFKDRTGSLRRSIVGGLVQSRADEIVGFVGAGNGMPGSEGRPNREYVTLIEFGEFSRAGRTSFLRDGVNLAAHNIFQTFIKELNIEKIMDFRHAGAGI